MGSTKRPRKDKSNHKILGNDYRFLHPLSGWWFGTCFIFPYIGNSHANWLIFFRGVETTNQLCMWQKHSHYGAEITAPWVVVYQGWPCRACYAAASCWKCPCDATSALVSTNNHEDQVPKIVEELLSNKDKPWLIRSVNIAMADG